MKKIKLIGLAAVLVLFFSTATALFYSFYMIKDVQVFPADVYLSEKRIGFNLDKDKIHFGLVPREVSSSERFVTISNKWKHGIDVMITGEGALGEWLYSEIKENGETLVTDYFYLEPDESKEVTLFVIPPGEAEANKIYEGTIKIILKRHRLFN